MRAEVLHHEPATLVVANCAHEAHRGTSARCRDGLNGTLATEPLARTQSNHCLSGRRQHNHPEGQVTVGRSEHDDLGFGWLLVHVVSVDHSSATRVALQLPDTS